MATRKFKAGCGQPPNPGASSRAYPPRRAQSQTSSIPQQPFSDGSVSCSTGIVGGNTRFANERTPLLFCLFRFMNNLDSHFANFHM